MCLRTSAPLATPFVLYYKHIFTSMPAAAAALPPPTVPLEQPPLLPSVDDTHIYNIHTISLDERSHNFHRAAAAVVVVAVNFASATVASSVCPPSALPLRWASSSRSPSAVVAWVTSSATLMELLSDSIMELPTVRERTNAN